MAVAFNVIHAPPLYRFVYISSAGVTRPGRPGINLEEEPPAVRMNEMLGGILTYKLKAEDAIRVSGRPDGDNTLWRSGCLWPHTRWCMFAFIGKRTALYHHSAMCLD